METPETEYLVQAEDIKSPSRKLPALLVKKATKVP